MVLTLEKTLEKLDAYSKAILFCMFYYEQEKNESICLKELRCFLKGFEYEFFYNCKQKLVSKGIIECVKGGRSKRFKGAWSPLYKISDEHKDMVSEYFSQKFDVYKELEIQILQFSKISAIQQI